MGIVDLDDVKPHERPEVIRHAARFYYRGDASNAAMFLKSILGYLPKAKLRDLCAAAEAGDFILCGDILVSCL